jgi:EmrB/QacA subfamily drug resistance transporter
MTLSALRLSHIRTSKWWMFFAIAVGTFTSVADFGSINVALPTIAEHFSTDLPTTQWVMIGYALTISALLLPMGRLSDLVGRKRIYMAGFGIFIVGGILAGTSQSILALIMFKVLQGVGAGMTQGIGMAMAISAFPSDERGKALGSHITTVGAGNIIGPAIGGLIVGELGWRWVFYSTVGLSVLSIVAVAVLLDSRRFDRRGEGKRTFDWTGAALSTAALVSFLLVMTNGPRYGWTFPPVMVGLVALVAAVTAFIWWELRTETPMMDVRLFKRRIVSLGVAAQFISFIGNSSVRFLMPFYLQFVLGYTPQQIGLIIVPSAFAMIVAGAISGRLSDRYGWRKFTVGGLTASVTGLFVLSTLTENSPIGLVIGGMVLMVGGNGTFYPPNNASILSTVEESKYGVMSGLVNLVRNSANITGVAVATAIVTAVMASQGLPPSLSAISETGGTEVIDAFVTGLRIAYRIIGTLVILGIVFSFIRGGTGGTAEPSKTQTGEAPAPSTTAAR